ncbi:MAG TPA: hypothetical protein PL007_05500 [Thermomonas sp.]|nr:hypothetical protein [Thermomonas sp.]HRA57860.1 hypothetical protein [Thermomonas sp.]
MTDRTGPVVPVPVVMVEIMVMPMVMARLCCTAAWVVKRWLRVEPMASSQRGLQQGWRGQLEGIDDGGAASGETVLQVLADRQTATGGGSGSGDRQKQCLGRENKLESAPAISAKPAPVRGFSVILGRSGKDALLLFRRIPWRWSAPFRSSSPMPLPRT